ncbi:MAG: hypothetical protein AAF333_11875 [Planctomycetota bacterium]
MPTLHPPNPTRVQNTTPRVDRNGNVIDCHNGCLRYFDDAFYLYGTSYSDTNRLTPANRCVAYRSENLATWEPLGEVLEAPLDGVGHRPQVVYNAYSGLFVLWFTWIPAGGVEQLGVATAGQPVGPFEVINPDVRVARPNPGNHSLFVDHDGQGYLIYTSIRGEDRGPYAGSHGISVEKLMPDFTASTLCNGGIFSADVEAPAMFIFEDRYYCIFGKTCNFDSAGTSAEVYRSGGPLGPWKKLTDINRNRHGELVVAARQTDITALPGRVEPLLVWIADRWGSAPDGIKGHDLQHWEPLSFDDAGHPQPLRDLDTWDYALP